LDAHVFHIQTLFLIKAIAVFNARAQAPIVVDLLNRRDTGQRMLNQTVIESFIIRTKSQGFGAWDRT
jgi:hypothetical protein